MAVPEIFLNGTSISCYNDGLKETVPNHKTALQLYNISFAYNV